MTGKDSTITQHPTPNTQRLDSCPKSDDVIHVVLAVYDPSGTYSQHAGVVMTSIFENTHSKVTVHILHDDTLTDDNRRKLLRTAEKYSQSLKFYDVTECMNKYAENIEALRQTAGKYSIGILYKLFIPDILNGIKKVIWLDCDVLVSLDIKELWESDMKNKTFAGVVDMVAMRQLRSFYNGRMDAILKGMNPDEYINVGVMVMNLERIREKTSLADSAMKWIIDIPTKVPEQDAINSIFAGDIYLLDSKFNQQDITSDTQGCMLHMYSSKSWASIRGFPSERLYWKLYLLTAWGENARPEDIVDRIIDVAEKHRKNPSPARKPENILRKLAKKLVYGILPMRSVKYIIVYAFHHLKRKFSHSR